VVLRCWAGGQGGYSAWLMAMRDTLGCLNPEPLTTQQQTPKQFRGLRPNPTHTTSSHSPIASNRPGLCSQYVDITDRHTRLLHHLPPHRLLNPLALINEAREAGVHAGRALGAAPQQRAVAIRGLHQHDHNGISAGVELVGGRARGGAPTAGAEQMRLCWVVSVVMCDDGGWCVV